MKRFVSVILALMLASTMLLTVGTAGAEEDKTIITATNPVITADVEQTVELSDYLVRFSREGKAETVEWFDSNGIDVTEIKASEKGVIKLVARAGTQEANVYFVAKEKDETEHILFEADYSKYTNIQQLKDEGYVTTVGDEYFGFADGALVMGSTAHDYVRIILPEWLGDFGDYNITAEVKMLETRDNARWFGLVYRIQNENKKYYPYYHMCVRENTTAATGIEFAERTNANNWNVALTASGEHNTMKNTYRSVNVKAFESNVQYNIDGKEEIFVTDAVIGNKAQKYEKGLIGLTMNYGKIAVKSIKIAVQSSVPEREKKVLNLINNSHYADNLINPIANVEIIDPAKALDSISKEGSGSVLINAADYEDLKPIIAKCAAEQVLPTVIIENSDELKKLNGAMNAVGMNDANVISSSAQMLKSIRANKALVRTGLKVELQSGVLTSDMADALRREIRVAPATFCVIKSNNATYQAVSELQELAVAVWVEVEADPASEEFTVEALKAITSGANGIISKSSKKISEVINEYLEKNTLTRTPVMIGHRGNPGQALENSLSGFLKAYENGADIFEIDVDITKDGEVIILHDSTLNRTTNYTGNQTIGKMTLEEVKQYFLKAKDGTVTDEKVPTLRELLELFKDKDCRIFVEFKGSNVNNVIATCALIKEYGMEDRVDVISFSTGLINQTQREIPGMSTGYLHSPSSGGTTPEDALEALYPSISKAQACKSSINPSNGVINEFYTQAVTDRGLTVWPWTYTAANSNNAFLSGCDGVTTDDMQWVKNMVKYITANDISVILDDNAGFGVRAITYGDDERAIDADKLIVKVLSGGDCISVADGAIKGLKQGNAKIMFGYKTKTTNNSEYVLYTQPVTVTVGVAVDETSASDKNGMAGGDWLVIAISAVIALGAVAAIVVFSKKKSK